MSVSELLVASFAPWITDDLEDYLTTIGEMFSEVELYSSDTEDGFEGWTLLLDPDRCPVKALPYLAQFVGERLPMGLSEAAQREWIKDAPNQRRGTVGAIVAAAGRYLTGAKLVTVIERVGGNPDAIAVVTYEDQTPDEEAVMRELLTVVPADISLEYSVVGGQTWAQVLATNDDWADVRGNFATWADLAAATPSGTYTGEGSGGGGGGSTGFNKIVGPGTPFATAIEGLEPGRALGLQDGLYEWGDWVPPAGVTIAAIPGANVTITGSCNPRGTDTGATIRNLTLRPETTEQKTVLEIEVPFTVDHCDLNGYTLDGDALAWNGVDAFPSVVFLGGIGVNPDDVRISYCKIHGVEGESESHAVYCAGVGEGVRMDHCWIYDYVGYGLHFNAEFTSVDNLFDHLVIGESDVRSAVVFDTEPGFGGPEVVHLEDSIIVAEDLAGTGLGSVHMNYGEAYVERCRLAGGTTHGAGDGVLHEVSNVTADTTFVNEAAYDYRVPGNADFQFTPGPP